MCLVDYMIHLYYSIECPEIRGPIHKRNPFKNTEKSESLRNIFYFLISMKTFIHRSHHLHELNHVITYLLYFTQGVTIKLPVNWHTVSFTSATVSAQASPLSAVRYLVGFGYGYFHTFRSVSDIWPMATMQGLLRSAQTVSCKRLTLIRWTHSAFRAYGVFYTGSLPTAVA